MLPCNSLNQFLNIKYHLHIFPYLYLQIAWAAWDFNKIYIDEGVRSEKAAVFDPVDKSDKIQNAKNVKFEVLEDGQESNTFKMDPNSKKLVIAQKLDRETKEVYQMTIEAKENVKNYFEQGVATTIS